MNWKDKLYEALVYIAVTVAAFVWMLSTDGVFGEYTWIPFYGIPMVGGIMVGVSNV